MKITVKVYDGSKEILSKSLPEGSHRAGRSEFCDIVLEGDQVSRSHMELRVTEASVYMTNMSSAGRVKVNGERVETAEIKDGDELQIGQYRIVVFHGERDIPDVLSPPAAEAEAPPALEESPPAEAVPEIPAFEPPAELPKDEPLASPPPMPSAEVIPMPIPKQVEDYPVEGTAALQRAETVVEAKPLVAKLIFTDGERKGEEMPLEAYEVSFGRSKKADVFLDDEKLSRKHCKIARVGMGYRLIDLNSRNGTYVNGMRVLEHPLSSFDVIEIGNTKMKFLIHDLVMGDVGGGALTPLKGSAPIETASLQMDPDDEAALLELQRNQGPVVPPSVARPVFATGEQPPKNRTKLLLALIGILGVIYFLLPSGDPAKPTAPTTAQTATPTKTKDSKEANVKVPPAVPKEYAELSSDVQRAMEGHYNSGIRSAEQDKYEDAVNHMRKIHEVLPYYKSSRDLQDQYTKKLKEKQIEEAQNKAKKDEKEDLAIYLEEGIEYLKEGDFDRAAEAFNSAFVIDPHNEIAAKGMRAAEAKVRDIEKAPAQRDPEDEKKKQVSDLFQKAVAAFTNKSYQVVIDTAEQIRKIELKNDTQYLNEAKQLIDRAKMLQKEEFEPFLIQAKEKYAEGDYNASRDLCEEMLKRDEAYEEAKECVLKAKKQLNRLAKEAYTHGYILESMNRIEEAKQYWNRAKNYVRPGDDYYEKVMKKLEYYQ
jgi:pSer/pThr/pTyr-binding forkhead associated (FHA) protein/tetratricopeptide (TPR) repeat protein